MKTIKNIVLCIFLLSMMAIFVSAGTPYNPDDARHVTCKTKTSATLDNKGEINNPAFDQCVIKEYIYNIIKNVQMIAGAVAALIATVVGFMFMNAKDPSEKKELGDKLKAIIVGLAIVLLSVPIVNLLM